ncbi:unnamed protein product [Leptosia nina]|uniref:Uncharacterized protein n=1 Tax=Leptosia nina TaxID=320188 RepID=A0AAV1JYW4_9NEOP
MVSATAKKHKHNTTKSNEKDFVTMVEINGVKKVEKGITVNPGRSNEYLKEIEGSYSYTNLFGDYEEAVYTFKNPTLHIQKKINGKPKCTYSMNLEDSVITYDSFTAKIASL